LQLNRHQPQDGSATLPFVIPEGSAVRPLRRRNRSTTQHPKSQPNAILPINQKVEIHSTFRMMKSQSTSDNLNLPQ
jgi:hypothetical protein